MPGPLQTLEQIRARHAWDCALEAKQKVTPYKSYQGLVKKLPAMIQTNGLGQALAYLASRVKKDGQGNIQSNTAERLLYLHIEKWLTRTAMPEGPYVKPGSGEKPGEPFKALYRLTRQDSVLYRQATREALALSGWLKSFADAVE